MITAIRLILVLAGVGMAAYGISLLWDVQTADQISLLIWLAAGLIAHDAILAPIYTMFGHAGRRLLPSTVWAPVLVAGAATLILVLLSLPVLAPRPDDKTPVNATILDRPYGLGLGIVVALIWVLAAVVATRNHRSLRRAPLSGDPASDDPGATDRGRDRVR
ncbi:hypothetical protein ACQ7HM_17470 [Williamsia sp. MIQD14]|uniref:hypothetical protein n=1 Tax=Williamsia sp. MIQD14 TaxID=3425703 RepID=UPI003DA011E9